MSLTEKVSIFVFIMAVASYLEEIIKEKEGKFSLFLAIAAGFAFMIVD